MEKKIQHHLSMAASYVKLLCPKQYRLGEFFEEVRTNYKIREVVPFPLSKRSLASFLELKEDFFLEAHTQHPSILAEYNEYEHTELKHWTFIMNYPSGEKEWFSYSANKVRDEKLIESLNQKTRMPPRHLYKSTTIPEVANARIQTVRLLMIRRPNSPLHMPDGFIGFRKEKENTPLDVVLLDNEGYSCSVPTNIEYADVFRVPNYDMCVYDAAIAFREMCNHTENKLMEFQFAVDKYTATMVDASANPNLKPYLALGAPYLLEILPNLLHESGW
jgi:hypothetical protein